LLELDELVVEDSPIQFDWCEFDADLASGSRPKTALERSLPIGCGVALVVLLIASLVGVATFLGLTIGWID
jgi:hypothetical protein